jgi:cellulose synthase operon protein B
MLTAQVPETSPGDGRLVVSLADAAAIGGRDGMLTGGDDGMSFALVLPPLAPARKVRLILTYENAIDILPEASVLEVTINDRQVAQLPLTAYAGAKTARIRLQPEYLAPGINRIRLHMLARHRAACGPQASYDLWTRPIVDRSMVEILYAHPPAAPDLATMGDMMAIPTAGGDPLTVLYPTARIDENMLGWGGLATQAYALRLGDRPAPVRALPVPRAAAGKQAADLRFPGIDLSAVPGTKIILAGMKSDLEPLLSQALTTRISGPYLGVFSLPGEHRRLLIVASGPTPADVDAALLAMADPRHVLPAQPDAIIQQMGILPAPVLPTLHADHVYKLADFGLETQTTRDYRAVRHLTVRLPADYFAVDDRKVTVRLNASYAGPIEPGAELTAIVNGQVISSIQLNHLSGEELRGREISLPMRLLRAGDNDIEFVATFPSSSKTCVTSPERPVFTLRDDSEIRMPAFARLEELPNLAVLGAVGYPYASDPADRNQRSQPFNLVLPVPEAKAASAAWMILGRLAQRSRSLVSFIPLIGCPPADRNSLIVGALRDLPELVAAAVATLAPEIDHQWRIGRLAFPPPGRSERPSGNDGNVRRFTRVRWRRRGAADGAAGQPASDALVRFASGCPGRTGGVSTPDG